MADSNLFDLDDTFDADESLLVSPAPISTTDEAAIYQSPYNFEVEPFNLKQSIDDEHQQFANEGNESIFSDDSSDSFGRTPVKPKFSYASAMDALDDLVPSAMKVKRRATVFSLEHSSAKKMFEAEREAAGLNERGLDELSHHFSHCSSPIPKESDELYDKSTEESGHSAVCEVRGSAPFESTSARDELDHSCGRHSYLPESNLNQNYKDDSYSSEPEAMSQLESCNESPQATELDDIEKSTTSTGENIVNNTDSKDSPSKTPSSAFRYPCIRQNIPNKENDLELKLGHPVNESSFFRGNTPQIIEPETSLELKYDSFGLSLDFVDRVDQIPSFQEVSEQKQDEESLQSNDESLAEETHELLDEPTDLNVARNENILADFYYHQKDDKQSIEESHAVLEQLIDNQYGDTTITSGLDANERKVPCGDFSVDRQFVVFKDSTFQRSRLDRIKSTGPCFGAQNDHAPDDNTNSCDLDDSLDNSTDGMASGGLMQFQNDRTSAAFQPSPEKNKASIKRAVFGAKPPARLLSGKDASMAKEISLRERVEKENATLRKQSTFKARPMPSSATVTSALVGDKLLAVGKENIVSSASKNRMPPAKPFIPCSTRRAEERAAFDAERARRESKEKARKKERRSMQLDKIKKDVDKLKGLIR